MIASLSLTLVAVTLAVHRITDRASTPFSLLQTYSILLGTSLALLAIYQIFIYPLRSPYRHLPSPKQAPLRKRFFEEPGHHQFMKWIYTVPHDGLIHYYGRFNEERILCCTPKGYKDIFQTQPYNFHKLLLSIRPMRSLAGDSSLFCTNGEVHKLNRRKTNPAFGPSTLREVIPLMWKHSKLVSEVMLKAAEQTPTIDVTRFYQAVTLDIIGSAGFGIEFNSLTDPKNSLARRYNEAFEPKVWMIRAPLLLAFPVKVVDKLLFFNKGNRKLTGSIGWIREYARKAINERRNHLQSEEKAKLNTNRNKPRDILDVTLAAEIFTTNEIVDSFMTFLLGGHETSATILNFFTFRISQDLDLQRRLREELHSVIPDPFSPDSTITAEQLAQLKLHHAVISETLRLYPAVPIVRRRCVVEGTSVNNLALRKDTHVVCPIIAIQRHKPIWGADAEEFKPQRWLDDPQLGGATDMYAFSAFSHGARHCIGERFARNEMVLIIAAIIGRMELRFVGTGRRKEPDPKKVRIIAYITQRILGGVWVEVRPVDGLDGKSGA